MKSVFIYFLNETFALLVQSFQVHNMYVINLNTRHMGKKVHTYRGGQKNWKNLPIFLELLSIVSNEIKRFFFNFVIFSEYLNFMYILNTYLFILDTVHSLTFHTLSVNSEKETTRAITNYF